MVPSTNTSWLILCTMGRVFISVAISNVSVDVDVGICVGVLLVCTSFCNVFCIVLHDVSYASIT